MKAASIIFDCYASIGLQESLLPPPDDNSLSFFLWESKAHTLVWDEVGETVNGYRVSTMLTLVRNISKTLSIRELGFEYRKEAL